MRQRPWSRGRHKAARSSFPGRTNHLLVVTVPTLLAPGNLPALQRVLLTLIVHLPKHFDRFYVDVVTEGDVNHDSLKEWLDGLGDVAHSIRIVNVPVDYTTPKGARFKTRANQYAMEVRRAAGENTSDAYVYHLDDDTHIGEDTAASLAEFIELDGDRFLLAQGVLAFPHYLTPSRFCRLADSIRPADDLTRFAFFTGALGTPLGGLHGEHLIIRADIEDEIGWDFPDTVIEDAYFAVQFSVRYQGRSTTLNSYSYGASPASIRDLVRQRRRWIEGLLRLAFNRRLPLVPKLPLVYSILTWSLAPLQFVGLALFLSYTTGIDNTSPVNSWVLPLWSLSLAYVFWLYIEGLKVNLSASDRPGSFLRKVIVLLPAIYIITAVETVGAMAGFVRFCGIGRQRVSEVITKPI
jgi:beta-1,4-mannosyltransferase